MFKKKIFLHQLKKHCSKTDSLFIDLESKIKTKLLPPKLMLDKQYVCKHINIWAHGHVHTQRQTHNS